MSEDPAAWANSYVVWRAGYEQPSKNATLEQLTEIVPFQFWTTKRFPYNDLAEGDAVYLMRYDADPSLRAVVAEMRVSEVVRTRYANRFDAWQQLDHAFGWTPIDPDAWLDHQPEEGYLFGLSMDGVALTDEIPFGFDLTALAGRNGFLPLDRLAASDHAKIDRGQVDRFFDVLPPRNRPVEAFAGPVAADLLGDQKEDAFNRRAPTKSVKDLVMERDGGRCQGASCPHPERGPFHFDHILPWSKNGSSDADNIQLLCQRCNLAKGAKVPPELAESLVAHHLTIVNESDDVHFIEPSDQLLGFLCLTDEGAWNVVIDEANLRAYSWRSHGSRVFVRSTPAEQPDGVLSGDEDEIGSLVVLPGRLVSLPINQLAARDDAEEMLKEIGLGR